ncbi:MAG: hypothetical protein U1C19_07945 [Methanobacteriaceae archaeon]|nr:hypothetical protein [Methanobacteriaceae archaeon]
MSKIHPNVIFKKDNAETISLQEKYVGLKSRPNGLLAVNFRTPEDEINNLKEFFESFQNDEPIKMDIGGTGDIECSFKGISPILEQKDTAGFTYFFLSVTLQDIKKMKTMEQPPNCGCGK